MITMHPKIKHKSQGNILQKTKIPSEQPTTIALEHDHLCTLVPSSGIGSYASQPCGTRRSTLVMLIEIMIQPQTHTKQPSMANTHARQYDD